MAELGGALRKGEALTVNSGNGYLMDFSATDGNALRLNINAALGSNTYGGLIYSNAVQTVGNLFRVHSDDATSSAVMVNYLNDGTGTGLRLDQNGALVSGSHGLLIYSNAVQTVTDGQLLTLHLDNSSSTSKAMKVLNDGSGSIALFQTDGVLGVDAHGVWIYSNTAQSNSTSLFRVQYDSGAAASTADLVQFYNGGTGNGVYLEQGGVLAVSRYGLEVYSNAAQVNAPLVYFHQDNASSTEGVCQMINDGTSRNLYLGKNNSGTVLELSQVVNDANPCYGLLMNLANAGAGLEYAFRFNGSEIVVAAVGGAQSHKIRASIAGTDFFIPCYTA